MAIKRETKDQILGAFDRQKSLYSDLSRASASLIETLLTGEGLVLHSLTHRCKDRQSLEGKLGRPDKAYEALSDITDIAGVRLTTYFADDVDKVADIIRSEFEVSEKHSVDKRVWAHPDRFGYLSLHFVVGLLPSRLALSEYARFRGMQFEIQVRSILQHAWAEIEHDLGYKSAVGLPGDVKRRFARVSSLLELADSEFSAIRQHLNNYEEALPGLIESGSEQRSLDFPTLKLLVSSDPDISLLDAAVVEGASGALDPLDLEGLSNEVDRLKFLGVDTVGKLQRLSKEHREDVRNFAAYWAYGDLDNVGVGIGFFYLCYVLIWVSKNRDLAISYLDEFNIDEESDRNRIAGQILDFAPGRRIED